MSRPSKFLLALVALAGLCLSAGALAQRNYDPSGRVARISDMRGSLSYSPSGDGDWYDAHRNRPLLRGDALWSDRGARAEVQAGSVWLRMDGETSVEFLELNDRMLQVEVAEGTINVRVRRMFPGQRVEIDTPNLALVIDRPGNFRIDVDGDGNTTTIETREGIAMVYGTGGRFPVRRGDVIVFYGEDIRDYEMYAFPSQDNFDRYVRLRDQRIDRSVALRYLGDDLVGFADLDDNGRWTRYPGYGNVWFPTTVYAGWAPYQDGEWIWQEPWGWTWVDDEAWAFAPSHYGRWAWIDGRWGWLPGSRNTRSIYAPALVAFIEDVGGSIGWFPLGPGDIYYPTYSVSSRYFSSVNSANTPLAAANLLRAYSSYGRANSVPLPQMQGPATAQAQVQAAPTQGGYRNRMAPGAVTVVRKDVFTNSRPVREAAQRGREREFLGRGELRRSLAARPEAAAIGADAPRARVRPPREVEDQQVFARNAPPAQQATPAPSVAAEAAAPAVRERPRRMRMLGEQTAGADVRATTAPQPAEAAAPAAAPAAGAAPAAAAPAGQLRPLDREALPRSRRGRRFEEQRGQSAPAAVPATTVPATAPAETPAPAAVEPARQEEARQEEARQAEQARAAAQTAREERRQAMEAQRKAAAEQEQAARAEAEAQRQREQARAEANAQQQREAVQAEAKAREERGQAQRAEQEAQRQQRESEQAQREAQKQQAEATQAADATPTTEAPKADAAATDDASADAAETGRPNARRCYSAERIEEMRKGGVPEQRIAKLKLCPTEPVPTQQ